MRNHVITQLPGTIEHVIYPLDTKPMHKFPDPPIKILHTQDTKEKRIEACLELLKRELEGDV